MPRKNARFRRIPPPKAYPPRNVSSQYDFEKGLLSISWEPPVKTTIAVTIAIGVPTNIITGNVLVAGYRAQYKELNGNWISLPFTDDTRIEVFLPEAQYETRVQSIDARGNLLSTSAAARNLNFKSDFVFPYGNGLIIIGVA